MTLIDGASNLGVGNKGGNSPLNFAFFFTKESLGVLFQKRRNSVKMDDIIIRNMFFKLFRSLSLEGVVSHFFCPR